MSELSLAGADRSVFLGDFELGAWLFLTQKQCQGYTITAGFPGLPFALYLCLLQKLVTAVECYCLL